MSTTSERSSAATDADTTAVTPATDATDATARVGATARPAACDNCGVALDGRWCHACGQDSDVRTDSLHGWLRENLSDLAHLDSRGLRSLRDLLFRPGRLTLAYFRGHRMRYLSAIQLYLIAAALFFLANSFRPFMVAEGDAWSIRASLGAMVVVEDFGADDRSPLIARGVTPERFESTVRNAADDQLPAFLIVVVVAFSLLVAALHPLRDRNLLKHVTFALHWTAFYLLIMIGERAMGAPPGEPSLAGVVLGVLAFVWLTLAVRRTYGQHWLLVVPKAFVLFFGFMTLLMLWVASVMEWALRTM